MESVPRWIVAALGLKAVTLLFADFDGSLFVKSVFNGTGDETMGEEIANSVTHGFGTLMSFVACYYLIRLGIHYRRSWQHWLSLSVFGFSMIILYACSTAYHVAGIVHAGQSEMMKYYRVLDHIGIFYLIAGTYTPLMLLNTSPKERNLSAYLITVWVWACAIAGTYLKLTIPIEAMPMWIQAGLYLAMGFSIVVVIKPVARNFPRVVMLWMFTGGFSYTFGVIFLLWDSLQYNHAIWHLFVMGGSASFFIGVLLSTLPQSSRGHLIDLAYNESRSVATKILSNFEADFKPKPDERIC